MSESISSINYPLKWLLNHSFFHPHRNRFFLFSLFLKYFSSKSPTFPSYFCSYTYILLYFFLGSLSKNDATRTKRFSRLYCRLANKSLKLLFLVPFFRRTEFFTAKGIHFLRKIYFAREFTHTLIQFSLISLAFPLANGLFSHPKREENFCHFSTGNSIFSFCINYFLHIFIKNYALYMRYFSK